MPRKRKLKKQEDEDAPDLKKTRTKALDDLTQMEGLEKLKDPVKLSSLEKFRQYRDALYNPMNLPMDYDPPVWEPAKDPHFDADEVVFAIGQRRSGKSNIAENILLLRRQLHPVVYCFSKTPENGFWQQTIAEDHIIKDLDEELFQDILDINEQRFKDYRKAVKAGVRCGNPLVTIILEDLLSDKSTRKSEMVRETIFNGRHKCSCLWVLSQDLGGLSADERKSVDRFILFRATDPRTRKMVRDSWGVQALVMYDKITREPHQALVINNKTGTPPEKVFMKYKADIKDVNAKLRRHNVVLGNDMQWEGIDIREQKDRWPIKGLKHAASLKKGFNLPVSAEAEEQEMPDADDGPRIKRRRIATDSTEESTTMFSWFNNKFT